MQRSRFYVPSISQKKFFGSSLAFVNHPGWGGGGGEKKKKKKGGGGGGEERKEEEGEGEGEGEEEEEEEEKEDEEDEEEKEVFCDYESVKRFVQKKTKASNINEKKNKITRIGIRSVKCIDVKKKRVK